MQPQKEKIKQLFYSNSYENQTLAFELAKSQGCYKQVIQELYDAWMAYPYFQKMQEYWNLYMGEMEEQKREEPFVKPKGLELKRFYLEEFCYDFFHPRINWSGRDMPPFDTFPLPLLNCTFVQELNLSWNNIQTIPKAINQLAQLRILDLSYNYELRELPDELGQLGQLQELYLGGVLGAFAKRINSHQEADREEYSHCFPDSFRALTSMKKILLGDVLLERLPDWINEWTQLEELHIHSGFGSHPTLHLPNSLTQCSNLKILHIGAYTTLLPENMHHLTQLQQLSIQPALYLPSSIQELKNLVSLDLSYTATDYPIHLEGYTIKWDLYKQGVPEGISRLKIYGWEWIKKMTWLKQFIYIDIPPYAFTNLEKEELQEALPNCSFVFEE